MQILYSVTPVQASTNTSTLVVGSTLNASAAWTLSYTIQNTGDNDMDYEVIAGNLSDLSDAIVVQNSATLNAGDVGSYSVSIPVWNYYGINIASTVSDAPGEASVVGKTKG